MSDTPQLHLGVALDGAGWHPAAWREPNARPDELFTAGYWLDLVRTAQDAVADLVTIEDTLALQSSRFEGPDERTDQVRGRLDAELVAARLAPVTQGIGLVPVVTVTHTEPFHVSKALATLDYTSHGRAGWQVRASAGASHAALFGRREVPELVPPFDIEDLKIAPFIQDVFDEAADAVEVVRRLWDSWEDDAEIRDVATDRFIDRDKLHYVDFEGKHFSVRGPSITPRPPQGQPVVTVLAHARVPYELAARSADVVFVTPHDHAGAEAILREVRDAEDRVGRTGLPLQVWADLAVVLDTPEESGADRKARLDALAGDPWFTDAVVVAGSAGAVADQIAAWHELGYAGVRLRPAVLPDDLALIARDLAPELRRRGLTRSAYDADSLRGLLGLPTDVPNRYATAR
ncbi:FMNH2-utilizing oxygenase [Cellulomonas chitinilytica]|uniref:FMNH2-utilizing oxygenase n=1 Tax=Cellulomonas chitinilytica TaxID=398759 RepID=A0A919P2X9_9CELL|nr:LLM class flavin-dependent oxidoreductase [Cellulomonas chitinilytica]GIG21730.1 FMNH2-utilizing oxygenase [Cellulomonas chitinilytica]